MSDTVAAPATAPTTTATTTTTTTEAATPTQTPPKETCKKRPVIVSLPPKKHHPSSHPEVKAI